MGTRPDATHLSVCLAHARCRTTYLNLMKKDNKLIVRHKYNKRHIFQLIIEHGINNFEEN